MQYVQNKKKSLILTASLVALYAFFYFVTPAGATTVAEQLTGDTYASNGSASGNFAIRYYFSTPLSVSDTATTTIKFKASRTTYSMTDPSHCLFTLFNGTLEKSICGVSNGKTPVLSYDSGTKIWTAELPAGWFGAYKQINFFNIKLGDAGEGANAIFVYGTTSNNYANGYAKNLNDSYTETDANINDIYFKVSEGADNFIDITSPNSTSTPIAEFSEWGISYGTALPENSDPDFYSKQVYVGTTTSTISTLAGATSFYSEITPGEITITKPFGMLGGTGTWYAQAYLLHWDSSYDTTPEVVATSSVISFVLNSPQTVSGTFTTPTSTASSTDWVLTCDPDDPLIERSLCNVAKFLFYPDSTAMSNLSNIKDDLQNKPPFGYIQSVSDAIDNINYSATSSAGLVDLSDLSDNLFTPLKTVVSSILWIVFVFWLFGRARHLEL